MDEQVIHAQEGNHFELQYVPHRLIDDYRNAGWRVVSSFADIHHGEHSVLMRRDAS
jgi:hypothetical protein